MYWLIYNHFTILMHKAWSMMGYIFNCTPRRSVYLCQQLLWASYVDAEIALESMQLGVNPEECVMDVCIYHIIKIMISLKTSFPILWGESLHSLRHRHFPKGHKSESNMVNLVGIIYYNNKSKHSRNNNIICHVIINSF